MDTVFSFLGGLVNTAFSLPVLFGLIITGIFFSFRSLFMQRHSLTHGFALLLGRHQQPNESKGALSHFQALSAALSATVGLGNIAGVALAVQFGGPGAVFWMWVVGLLGMAIKSTEVTVSLLFRNTDDAENPHGGPMWVAKKGLPEISEKLTGFGLFVGGLFSVAAIMGAIGAGNMFQAWSVGDTTSHYFGVSPLISGIALAAIVGIVIIGGIRRIGQIAAMIVPFMCGIYVLAGLYVIGVNSDQIGPAFKLIIDSAFSPQEAGGAFVGASAYMAFIWGMKRALFSSESGMGSAPIAHSAVKTNEPATEGVLAGLEPFIDTLVVCTITALVILTTGIWNRDAVVSYDANSLSFAATNVENEWRLLASQPPIGGSRVLEEDEALFMPVDTGGDVRERLRGNFVENQIQWQTINSDEMPKIVDSGVYQSLVGATMTASAFDSAADGLGKWMVTMAVWLFAISTMISWSYYGEQGMVYLFGDRGVLPYRIIYCAFAVVACSGFITTGNELDTIGTAGLGLMMLISLPLTILFSGKAIQHVQDYMKAVKR